MWVFWFGWVGQMLGFGCMEYGVWGLGYGVWVWVGDGVGGMVNVFFSFYYVLVQ